jgi:hypothetical protein
VGAPLRILPPLVITKKIRFGTVGMGLDLPRLVWAEECQLFSSQDVNLSPVLSQRPVKQEVRRWDQLPQSFLGRNPVDVLLIDAGGNSSHLTHTLTMVENTTRLHRPKVLVISGPSRWVLDLQRDSDRKERRKRLEKLGYCCLEWFINAGQQGSALQQERLVEVCIAGSEGRAMPVAPPHQGLPARPMKNLLLPPGTIPRRSLAPPKAISWLTEAGPPDDGLLIVGHVGRQPLHSSTGCMPDELGAWIADSDTGVRRLLLEG